MRWTDRHFPRVQLWNPKEEKNCPERLSGHKILGDIGVGGMGQVLLGYDERLNRELLHR
jgi:hypothetical protein